MKQRIRIIIKVRFRNINMFCLFFENIIFVLARIIIAAIRIDSDVRSDDIWSVIIMYDEIVVNE